MGLRIAKIDQHAVAHVFRDKPGEAGDGVGDTAVIGADNLAKILGIESRRQRRRADKIAKHNGQLAPLRLATHRGGRGGCGFGHGF
jgi:hypothetical protein